MCKNKRNKKKPNIHNAKFGKGGFTLVELCVVLALVAIVTTMIVSFSVQMNSFATDSQDDYKFLEDCSTLNTQLYKWIAENDIQSAEFFAEGEKLTVTKEGESKLFSLGEKPQTVEDIEFIISENGDLIKCTISQKDGSQKTCYVFALRCADIATVEGGGVGE